MRVIVTGIISFYELWIRGLPGPDGQRDPIEQRIFHPSGQYDPLNPDQAIMVAPATSFNVTDLQPFTVYEFQVLAENEAGRAASPWTPGRTQETCKGWCVSVLGGWLLCVYGGGLCSVWGVCVHVCVYAFA